MSDKLQEAIDNLQISDVYFRHQLVDCDENFDPKLDDDIASLVIEFRHHVRQSIVLQVNEDHLLKVFIGLGVRWRRPLDDEDSEDSTDPDENEEITENIIALIEGELVAEYRMKKLLDRECIEQFSKQNASFHVWPYWRETVQSTCAKMNFPQIVLPAVQFAQNRATQENLENEP